MIIRELLPKSFITLAPGNSVIKLFMVNYRGKKTLLFLGLKYHGNLLSYCSSLTSFQGKFDVINITKVIQSKMAVNYRGICFITLAPGHLNCRPGSSVIKLLVAVIY
jgi:hypothetical protein